MNKVYDIIRRNKLEKAVMWMIVIASGSLDVATWYVAFTNGPVVLAIILLHRVLMGIMIEQNGYLDMSIAVFDWLLS